MSHWFADDHTFILLIGLECHANKKLYLYLILPSMLSDINSDNLSLSAAKTNTFFILSVSTLTVKVCSSLTQI